MIIPSQVSLYRSTARLLTATFVGIIISVFLTVPLLGTDQDFYNLNLMREDVDNLPQGMEKSLVLGLWFMGSLIPSLLFLAAMRNLQLILIPEIHMTAHQLGQTLFNTTIVCLVIENALYILYHIYLEDGEMRLVAAEGITVFSSLQAVVFSLYTVLIGGMSLFARTLPRRLAVTSLLIGVISFFMSLLSVNDELPVLVNTIMPVAFILAFPLMMLVYLLSVTSRLTNVILEEDQKTIPS